MNGQHPTQELLQRYLDGELSSSQRAELRSHVAGCASCTRQETSRKRLQQLVAQTVTERADAIDLSSMFQNIEAGIAAEEAEQHGEVRSNGADGKPVVLPLNQKQPAKKVRRFSSAAPVLGAFALAAAVMLMVYRPENSMDADEIYETDGGRSEVTDVDFGSSAGTVFDISLSDGSSTPVVWIDDDGDDDDQE